MRLLRIIRECLNAGEPLFSGDRMNGFETGTVGYFFFFYLIAAETRAVCSGAVAQVFPIENGEQNVIF